MKNKIILGLLSIFTFLPVVSCTPSDGPTHTHSWKYTSQESEGHLKYCTECDEKSIEKHKFTTKVIQEASKYQKGITEYTCKTCGYKYQSEFDPSEQQVMNETAKEIEDAIKLGSLTATKAQELIGQYKELNYEARGKVSNINEAKKVLKTPAIEAVDALFNKIVDIENSENEIKACLEAYNGLNEEQHLLLDSEDSIVELKALHDYYKTLDVNDYKTQQQIVCNTAMAYFYQKTQLQYDQLSSRKNVYLSPEDCNEDNYSYLDCSSFTNQVYYELFGQNIIPNKNYPSSVNTAGIANYASDHSSNHKGKTGYEDIIYRWTKSDLESAGKVFDFEDEEETDEYCTTVRRIMEAGDVYVYRHGGETSGGHAMLYLGEYPEGSGRDIFVHSSGADNGTSKKERDFTNDNWLEGQSEAEKANGTLAYDTADIVFIKEFGFDSTGSFKDRYMFNEDNTSWTILRPIKRMQKNNFAIKESSINRLLYPYMNAELTSDIHNYHSVEKNTNITYTITVKNESTDKIMPYAFISQELPANCEFVSCSEEGTFDNLNKVEFRLSSIYPGQTKTCSFTVKATGEVGSSIVNNKCYCNNTRLNKMTNEIRAHVDYDALVEAFTAKVGSSYTYATTAAVEAYNEVFGVNLKEAGVLAYESSGSYKLGDNTLISQGMTDDNWKSDKSLFKDLVPSILFGGTEVRSAHSANDNDIRNMEARFLEPGDLVGVKSSDGNTTFIYISPTCILKISSGKLKQTLTKEDDVAGYVHSLCYEKQFIVVRPSLCGLLEVK